jgi:hypothetical protein
MNTAVLIDAIVRQTTVLIAGLATASGQRTPLSRVADQVFADLVRELSDQGLGHKVIADMFGIALRTYHARVARLAASRTDHGRSLWEAVLSHVEKTGPVTRIELLHRFQGDDEATVRGVLRDLVDSELLYQTGRAEQTSYRAADALETIGRRRDPETLDRFVQVAIYRHGPVERARLSEVVPLGDEALLEASLARLCAEPAIVQTTESGVVKYDAEAGVIAFGDPAGWEAAIFDHYQALVTALVTKLRLGKRSAALSDQVGGSTFVFDLWDGHPLEQEIRGLLRTLRVTAMDLRKRLEEHNLAAALPPQASALRVIAYLGQSVQEEEHRGED